MAKTKKRRKVIIFSLIGLVLAGLTAVAILREHEVVITVQTEKVTRRNLTELVSANGKIQPVVQVKISPEVSGEITDLPVKEGQCVRKGDLILKIKPDYYIASRNQAQAAYEGSQAGKATAEANLHKAEAEYKRSEELYTNKLISDSAFDEAKAAYEVAQAQLSNAGHQVEMARASLASAEDALAKTTILSPLTGTVSKLNSEVGERVVGTATMAGTEVMTIADLNEMEARVDIGETDVVLIKPGQHVRLDVDAFKDQKFSGTVTEIANSAETSGAQEATKFQVKIRIKEKAPFRPGMSVTAEVETRYRTNALTVPIASVTTRLPKEKETPKASLKKKKASPTKTSPAGEPATTNGLIASVQDPEQHTNHPAAATNALAADSAPDAEATNASRANKKQEPRKPVEVVFVVEDDHVKMVPVKIGICDDNYWEITDGLREGQEVVSGGFRAISRDLEDGTKIRIGPPISEKKEED